MKPQLNVTYIIIASILGLAILGYGFLNYLSAEKNRQLEMTKLQQAQNQASQKQEAVQQQQTSQKQALNTCLLDAETNYSDNWFTECKSEGLLTQNCIDLHSMTFIQYEQKNNISTDDKNALSDFLKAQSDCSCRLPSYNADSINKTLQDDKDNCFREFPQN
ncbi:MAG TPA: hypothetical protein VF810_00255 [Patescibacteria group bacterium]